MSRFKSLVLAVACAILLIPLLGACRVEHPFRGPGYDATKGVVHPHAGRHVFIAVTQGDIAAGEGKAFSGHLAEVLRTMDEHDGLIGYAVRKELIGSRVWTMSAWVDRDSMERFARSRPHREAIAEGGIPRSSFIVAFSDVEIDRVPLDWSDAERLLEHASSTKE